MGTKRHFLRTPERRIITDTASVFDDAEIAKRRQIVAELGSATISTSLVMPSTHDEVASDKTFKEVRDYLGGTLNVI